MKKIVIDNEAHLILYSITEIPAGVELRYNYGVVNLEWRKEVLLYDSFCFSFELFAPIKT